MSKFCTFLGDDGHCFNLMCGHERCPEDLHCDFLRIPSTDTNGNILVDTGVLIQKIKSRREITLPDDAMALDDMRFWVHGYMQCQKDIVAMIEGLIKDDRT